jgi:hypothetical protein
LSSICQNIEVLSHFLKIEVLFHISLLFWTASRAGGRLCKMKIRLTLPSLAGTWAELGKRAFRRAGKCLRVLGVLVRE